MPTVPALTSAKIDGLANMQPFCRFASDEDVFFFWVALHAFRSVRPRERRMMKSEATAATMISTKQQLLLHKCQKAVGSLATILLCNVVMKTTAPKTNKRKFHLSPVIVTGAGFRCMAFRDAQGNLRNFWNQALLPLPVNFLDPEN